MRVRGARVSPSASRDKTPARGILQNLKKGLSLFQVEARVVTIITVVRVGLAVRCRQWKNRPKGELMSDIVRVENLVKRYGDLLALDHFNLRIAKGEIFGLLGPNGSGKTTSINCILQLLTYDKGHIELFGEPMEPTRYDLKRRIGVVPQQVAVFDELTVRENIDYFCSLYVADRARRRALVDEAIEFVGLGDYVKFRPGKLSGGLARRLNIACGIAHKPELIFFDEPTVAVDPQSRNSILDGICRLRD